MVKTAAAVARKIWRQICRQIFRQNGTLTLPGSRSILEPAPF